MPESTFYQQVYAVVRQIPAGKVCTYGQIAIMVGSPGAARQVGWALAGLPPKTDVPWQRVINAKGGISLRGRGDAAELQQLLLEAEGIAFDENDKIDLSQYQYIP